MAHYRQLRAKHDGSAAVTIPKEFVDDEIPDQSAGLGSALDGVRMRFDRLGDGCYLARVDHGDGDLPDIEDLEEVQRLAGQIVLNSSTPTASPTSD